MIIPVDKRLDCPYICFCTKKLSPWLLRFSSIESDPFIVEFNSLIKHRPILFRINTSKSDKYSSKLRINKNLIRVIIRDVSIMMPIHCHNLRHIVIRAMHHHG